MLGAASAFVESTLAQLYKSRGARSFVGGPAYYISKGIGSRAWAVTFAVLITLTFGLAFNSVQANTISEAFGNTFEIPHITTGITLSILTLIVIWGGIQSIARFSQYIVPIMAVAYLLLAITIIALNLDRLPLVLSLIIENAFGINETVGGTMGMAVVMGTKRGLFSNEAGEGSAPNVAATASVSHPVKQGLIQALGVLTDTLLICSCTAFIILCSGVYTGESDGIVLTQETVDAGLGLSGAGSVFISIAIFFFAFTSIIYSKLLLRRNQHWFHQPQAWVDYCISDFSRSNGLYRLSFYSWFCMELCRHNHGSYDFMQSWRNRCSWEICIAMPQRLSKPKKRQQRSCL